MDEKAEYVVSMANASDLQPETVVTFGGQIKSLGENRIGGYLIRFTDQDRPS